MKHILLFVLISLINFSQALSNQERYSIECVKEDEGNFKPDKILNFYHVLILDTEILLYAYYSVTNVFSADYIVFYFRPWCLGEAQKHFPEYELEEDNYISYEKCRCD